MRIWHYTVGVRLRSILKDQMIEFATTGIRTGERPVVWATTSPKWEPTANKAINRDGHNVFLDKRETTTHGEGLYRIEVMPEAVPYGWDEYKRLSNIDERMAKGLARVAREQGSNYRDWRVSFKPVAADQWLRIEFEVGHSDEWTEISMDLVKTWTQPVIEKGCPVCHEMEERWGRPWRYMPDPLTGEPRAVCTSCYTVITKRAAQS